MMDQQLSEKACSPCRGGVPPMEPAAAEARLGEVPGWSLTGDPLCLRRTIRTNTFMAAQTLATRVGAVAEEQGHHPDLCYGWGYCTISFHTHKIKGLHDNDFIMAAKVNALVAEDERT